MPGILLTEIIKEVNAIEAGVNLVKALEAPSLFDEELFRADIT